nr:ferritin-like protein [Thetidibacter halocola]
MREHLQAAVDLEFWTIPFYMTALYSIKDRNSDAFKLIMSVANEEMLHVQLASNAANAFGVTPTFDAPVYDDRIGIPHLQFALDTPNPTDIFTPHSAELGPLDLARINAMCLIEYPEWLTAQGIILKQDRSAYGSIGAFYDALRYGARQYADAVRGNVNQVDIFKNFFSNFPTQTVTDNGARGLAQVMTLFEAITEQGEGKSEGSSEIPPEFRNTADDDQPDEDHYVKFLSIRDAAAGLPATYSGDPDPKPGTPGHEAQQILIGKFGDFRVTLAALFAGAHPGHFGREMSALGGYVLNCWKLGAVPKFS